MSAKLAVLRDRYDFFARQAQPKYGDIFTLDAGLTRVIVLNHPEHIAHVFRKSKLYVKEGVMWDTLRSLLGEGLIISQGQLWRQRRRMMQPYFKRQRLAGLTDAIAGAIDEVVDTWAARTHAPVNMNELCPHMTMLVTVRAIFGEDMSEADVNTIGAALKHIFEFMIRGMALERLPDWVPLPGRKSYEQSLATLDEVVDRMIARHRTHPAGDNLLSMLLELRDEETEETLDDRAVHDEVINLFLAGYETTATGMAWAFDAVARYPEVAARVYEEVMEVTGGECPRFEHIAQLSYTRMVVKEALRRFPPAWQLMRTALEDDVIGDYFIPAGSQVMLSLTGSHLHPDVWPDPLRFDPLRFTPEREAARPKFSWMPFGAGQRMCIGYELALMESSIMLAEVIRNYELHTVPGRASQPRLSMVTTSVDGIWLQLTSRESA